MTATTRAAARRGTRSARRRRAAARVRTSAVEQSLRPQCCSGPAGSAQWVPTLGCPWHTGSDCRAVEEGRDAMDAAESFAALATRARTPPRSPPARARAAGPCLEQWRARSPAWRRCVRALAAELAGLAATRARRRSGLRPRLATLPPPLDLGPPPQLLALIDAVPHRPPGTRPGSARRLTEPLTLSGHPGTHPPPFGVP